MTLNLKKRNYRFFQNEARATHELFAELFASLVGNIISWNHKPLSGRHVLSYLVHFAVHHPPIGLIVSLSQHRRWREFGPPAPWARIGIGSGRSELEGGKLELTEAPSFSREREHWKLLQRCIVNGFKLQRYNKGHLGIEG